MSCECPCDTCTKRLYVRPRRTDEEKTKTTQMPQHTWVKHPMQTDDFFFQIRVTICNNSFKTFFLYTVVSIEHDLNFTLMGTRKQWTTVAQILIKYSKHI